MPFIPTAATNPRQKNRFRVDIEGLEAAYVYSIKLPKVEAITKEYRGGGELYSAKYPVGMKISDFELSKIMPADSMDYWAWNWLITVVDPDVQRIGVPSEYKKDIEVQHLNWLSVPIHTWYMAGAWPKIIDYGEQGAEDLDKVIQGIVLSVESCEEI